MFRSSCALQRLVDVLQQLFFFLQGVSLRVPSLVSLSLASDSPSASRVYSSVSISNRPQLRHSVSGFQFRATPRLGGKNARHETRVVRDNRRLRVRRWRSYQHVVSVLCARSESSSFHAVCFDFSLRIPVCQQTSFYGHLLRASSAARASPLLRPARTSSSHDGDLSLTRRRFRLRLRRALLAAQASASSCF